MKRSKRAAAISDVMDEQSRLYATVLWKFPREDFADWIRLGMGEADTYNDYLRRLKDAERVADEHGMVVFSCTKSPIAVAAWMISEDLDPATPEHRAMAISILWHGNKN